MTDEELFELHTMVDVIGVRPHDKVDAIRRLEERGYLTREPNHGIALTDAAVAALGKMRFV